MRCAADPVILEALPRAGLPAWCDRFLAAPGSGTFFASRLLYDCLLAHALPRDATPLLGATGAAMLPLQRVAGRVASLTGPYSLDWRPLGAPGAMGEAGHALGRALRGAPPARLDTLDPAAPGLEEFMAGLRAAGLGCARFVHVANWHETLPPGRSWEEYVAGRPSALQATLRRKRARAAHRFEMLRAPGPPLEAGIAAYEAVRARSWKPEEPFPDFDAALMRRAAAAGLLRLGILWAPESGAPVAAQYWILDGGTAWLLKLAHDEARRAESPGTLLTARMIRAMLEEGAVRELDFGRGDDGYKRLWVAERRQRIGFVIADPWRLDGMLALARQAAGQARRRVQAWHGAEAAR